MNKIHPNILPNLGQNSLYFVFTLISIFLNIIIVQAQPEFSKEELRLLKTRGHVSGGFKYHLPQDKFPMPEITQQNGNIAADGDLDASFNASVTEGFGYVSETVVQPDGKIIVVGLFQRANGTRTNGIARLNADGSLDTSFNAGGGANAAIRAVALQSDGKIIVGGAFTSFNNQAVNRIVRLNSNGSIDSTFSLTVAFNNQINDILILPDGKIMVGGQFNLSSTRLVRLNSNGTLDSVISGFNSTVFSIARATDGKIVLGGQFTSPRQNVARLNADGSLDSTFNPTTGGEGYPVYKVLVQPNGKVLAGGVFLTFNGTPTDSLVRLNDNGTVDASFEITNNPNVLDLEIDGLAIQPDGKILVSFFSNGGTLIADVRRFNADATPDSTFNTNTDNTLAATDLNLLSDGSIIAAGFFVTVNNQQRLRLAKLSSNGAIENSFNPAISSFGIVYAIKRQADGKIIVGGDFEYVNGVRRRAVARLNTDGSVDNTFNAGVGFYGDVYSLAVQTDGKIIIGGLFNGDLSFPGSNIVRLNSNGGFDTAFSGSLNFVNVAYAIAIQPDGKIVVGGLVFSNLGDLIALARFTGSGAADTSFTAPFLPTGSVRAILLQPNEKIIIGGTFFNNGTFQRTGLARLNANGSLDSTVFGGNANVASIKNQADGSVVSGGSTLTRHSSEGVIDGTLNIGTGFNSQIRAVEIQPDNKIVLGGFFTTYNGAPVNRLIRLSSVGALDSSFNANPSGTVLALERQTDGKILVGGQFLDFNGTEKFSIARLQNSIPTLRRAPFDFDGDGKTDVSIFRSSVGEWWYSRSSDGQVPAAQFGASTDKPTPADFTGDGKTDIAFWRPATGGWFVLRSEDNSFFSFPFGASGDIPAPADYDGDGKADAAVFRPSTATWFILNSGGGTTIINFGLAEDKPVPADYDGDGKTDIAIFRPSEGSWWYRRSSDSQVRAFLFGVASDKPVQGDWTGDGKADIAVFRPSNGFWYVLRSEDNSFYSAPFGASGDVPTPGDYDGDGRFDFAVFRPSATNWYVLRTNAGLLIQQFGLTTDTPLPSVFIP